MTRTIIRVAATALATLTLAAPCIAQRSTQRVTTTSGTVKHVATDQRPTGFMLGVRTVALAGLSMPMENADGPYQTKFGAGAGVMLGYGFNQTFSAYSSLDLVKQNTDPNEAIQGS